MYQCSQVAVLHWKSAYARLMKCMNGGLAGELEGLVVQMLVRVQLSVMILAAMAILFFGIRFVAPNIIVEHIWQVAV